MLARARGRGADGLGRGGHGLRPRPRPAQLAGGRRLHHVLAVPPNEELWAGTDLWRVDEVQAACGEWHRLSAGPGSKGGR